MKYLFLALSFLALTSCATLKSPAKKDQATSSADVDESESLEGGGARAKAPLSVPIVPAVSNASMGKAIAHEILRKWPIISDMKTLAYANMVSQYISVELVPSLKCKAVSSKQAISAKDIRVAIIEAPGASSFSIPGGYIFITTGMMQKMNSEDELAGIIANETVQSLCEKGVPNDLAAQVEDGWARYVGNLLSSGGLTREDLMFADRYTLVALYRRGYDVNPYVDYISKYESVEGVRRSFGTERAAALRKSIAATPPIKSTMQARLARFKAAKAKAL